MPDEIARNYVWLYRQKRSAWTFEMDLQALGGDMVMQPAIEFLFDFASPNVYLAYRALPPILERTGARLELTPCLLGGIFKATNNKSPIVAFAPVKGKVEYEMLEIRRFVARHRNRQVPHEPAFPGQFADADAGAHRRAGARISGMQFVEMGLKGMWEDGLKLDDPEVLRRRSTRPDSTA